MSHWTVHLELEEGTSRKFWRARVDGRTLHVSYGRIGTSGQTQVKELADAAAAQREYEKLLREKRKKGYVDAGGAGASGAGARGDAAAHEDADADEDAVEGGGGDPAPRREPAAARPAAAKPAAAARPVGGHRMVLEADGRRVEARLYLDGATVRMDAVEAHASPEAAKQAYERLRKALAGDGYRDD